MWKRQLIGLILLGLAEAVSVIPPWPVSHYRKRADVQIGGGLGDVLQKANVLAETVKVIGLPFCFPSSLSGSNMCCIRFPLAPS